MNPATLFPKWLAAYSVQCLEISYAAEGWTVYAHDVLRDRYGHFEGATLDEAMAAAEAGLRAGLPPIGEEEE